MESNLRVLLLIGVSICLVLLSRLYFSAVSLMAFVPLVWLLENSAKRKIPILYWFLGSVAILTISSLFNLEIKIWGVLYGAGLTLALSLYLLTSRFSKNRLGMFTILFFWLGFDYLVLKVVSTAAPAFLSSFFDGSKAMGWSRSTGNLGITAWVVISNLLFYYVLLWRDAIFQKTIRWMSLIYALLLISLPVVISFYVITDLAPITVEEMKSVYMNSKISLDVSYAKNGEWLGRISAWVSIMIVVYAVIKSKTK
ncbi:MAG: hypothetical protein AAF519_09755 [Bacteroidota bacterium]